MTTQDFTNTVDGLTNDFIHGVSTEKEFKGGIMEVLLQVAAPLLTSQPDGSQPIVDLLKLADLCVQVRATQTAYFASRKESKFGDKQILQKSKRLETELDMMVANVIVSYINPLNK